MTVGSKLYACQGTSGVLNITQVPQPWNYCMEAPVKCSCIPNQLCASTPSPRLSCVAPACNLLCLQYSVIVLFFVRTSIKLSILHQAHLFLLPSSQTIQTGTLSEFGNTFSPQILILLLRLCNRPLPKVTSLVLL